MGMPAASHHESLERLLCVFLLAELGVHVAGEVVAQIFANAQLLELAADRGELLEYVFVELLEVFLQRVLVLRDGQPVLPVLLRRWKVHVLQQTQDKKGLVWLKVQAPGSGATGYLLETFTLEPPAVPGSGSRSEVAPHGLIGQVAA